MKKLLTILLILALVPVHALAAPQTIDLETMTVDELSALKDQLNGAIWSAADWEEVVVPQGVWAIGEDIPAGHWTISAADGAYSFVQWGKKLNETKTGLDWNTFLDSKSLASETAYAFDENSQQTSVDWDLTDGTYIVIENGKAVFTPYQGKVAFSFSGMKPKESAAPADGESAMEETIETPAPTAELSPEPTAEPTVKPAAEPTPAPTAEPTPAAAAYAVLEKGSKGDKVKQLQQRLIDLKYLAGKADGGYGEKTALAVTTFQKVAGITPSGVADAGTQEALFSDDAKENPDPPFDPSRYEKMNYKAVARDPDAYVAKLITFTGKVVQVMEGDGETQYRIASKGSYDDVVYVTYTRPEGASRILDDDKVTVYGLCLGVVSYQSTMGGKITIPACMATRIELR